MIQLDCSSPGSILCWAGMAWDLAELLETSLRLESAIVCATSHSDLVIEKKTTLLAGRIINWFTYVIEPRHHTLRFLPLKCEMLKVYFFSASPCYMLNELGL